MPLSETDTINLKMMNSLFIVVIMCICARGETLEKSARVAVLEEKMTALERHVEILKNTVLNQNKMINFQQEIISLMEVTVRNQTSEIRLQNERLRLLEDTTEKLDLQISVQNKRIQMLEYRHKKQHLTIPTADRHVMLPELRELRYIETVMLNDTENPEYRENSLNVDRYQKNKKNITSSENHKMKSISLRDTGQYKSKVPRKEKNTRKWRKYFIFIL